MWHCFVVFRSKGQTADLTDWFSRGKMNMEKYESNSNLYQILYRVASNSGSVANGFSLIHWHLFQYHEVVFLKQVIKRMDYGQVMTSMAFLIGEGTNIFFLWKRLSATVINMGLRYPKSTFIFYNFRSLSGVSCLYMDWLVDIFGQLGVNTASVTVATKKISEKGVGTFHLHMWVFCLK